MATQAEKIESSQKPTAALKEAVDDVNNVLENFVATAYDNAENEDVSNKLKEIEEAHGHHAYRYEVMDDGSVVAVWGRKAGDLYYKAFPNMEMASLWSPRLED